MVQLLVILIIIVRDYGDPIFKLEAKGVDSIVNNNQILEINVGENSEILNVDILGSAVARVTVKSKVKQFVVWVKKVQDRVSVGLVGSCEHNHLKFFSCCFDTFKDKRSNVDSSLYNLVFKLNINHMLRLFHINVVNTVNQSLVHIKNNCLLNMGSSKWR